MKQLHKLILKSYIGPFVLIFFIVMFVLLLQFLWKYIDDLVGKGLEFNIIAELLFYTSASLVPMALPLSILMASLMTFGNMGEFYELTAIKASGISLQKILFPLFIFVIIVSIAAFFFSNNVMPYTNLKMRSLLYDVTHQRPELQIKAGIFYSGIENYSIRVNSKDPVTNMMYDIKIYDHSEGKGNVSVIIADSGIMKMTADERNLILTLYNGYSYNELLEDRRKKDKSYPHRFDKFKSQQIVIELTGFGLQRTDENLFKNNYQMMNLSQLAQIKDSLNDDINSKQDVLYNNLIKYNYYKTITNKEINIRRTLQEKRENKDLKVEIGNLNKNKIVDLDSIYNILTFKEKLRIITSSLSNTRSTKDNIDRNYKSLDYQIRNLRKHEIEWHRKFTLSFACFIFLFIGAPLGAIIRKGGLGMPLVISVLFFIVYYVMSLMTEKFVRESILLDYQGMWIPSLILLLIGIFLTYKATTDSSLFNMETYSNFIKRIFVKKEKVLLNEILTKFGKYPDSKVKPEKLLASLESLKEYTDICIEEANTNLRLGGFIFSLFALRGNTNLILFQRLYINIIKSIVSSKYYNNTAINSKLAQFPNFNYKKFVATGLDIIILMILLIIIPVTILVFIRYNFKLSMIVFPSIVIVLIRHHFKITLLKEKLKVIRADTIEIFSMIKNENL